MDLPQTIGSGLLVAVQVARILGCHTDCMSTTRGMIWNPVDHKAVLAATALHQDCDAKCNATKGCVMYTFADASCSGTSGPICWTKSAVGAAVPANCRNSAIYTAEGADIPSHWASDVSANKTPLAKYPRPQLVRGSHLASFNSLRDAGDISVWSNLNGLWEWEAATSQKPPFGRALRGSILVPFPVESCLSGVAPNSTTTVVTDMWYRLVFDAERSSDLNSVGRTLLHFGAVDWQASVYLNEQFLGNHTGMVCKQLGLRRS